MAKGTTMLIFSSYIIVGLIFIITVLVLINRSKRKRFSTELSNLERDKNLIISAQILAELNKVEGLINNDVLKEKFQNWQDRFNKIKNHDLPKVTDSLIRLEELFALFFSVSLMKVSSNELSKGIKA